jgi:hypothetical protein
MNAATMRCHRCGWTGPDNDDVWFTGKPVCPSCRIGAVGRLAFSGVPYNDADADHAAEYFAKDTLGQGCES